VQDTHRIRSRRPCASDQPRLPAYGRAGLKQETVGVAPRSARLGVGDPQEQSSAAATEMLRPPAVQVLDAKAYERRLPADHGTRGRRSGRRIVQRQIRNRSLSRPPDPLTASGFRSA
jgi:hypothetical protein